MTTLPSRSTRNLVKFHLMRWLPSAPGASLIEIKKSAAAGGQLGQGSVVLAADVYGQLTVKPDVKLENNRPAADLAILNVTSARVTGL